MLYCAKRLTVYAPERKREKQNLEQRSHEEAFDVFGDLMENFYSFSTPVRKRLKMIEKNWKEPATFYFENDAPAINNPIENYSTSLKTNRKKQLRERGIKNQFLCNEEGWNDQEI